MATINYENVFAAIQRANISLDPDIRNDEIKRYKSVSQKIFADESLTENEKMGAMIIITQDHDYIKVLNNKGEKSLCKDCNHERLATLYCEHCVRIYLINNFSNWTSGNNIIDSIIQEHQMESVRPDNIIEWIPYNKLQNVDKFVKGGNAQVYSAKWIDGRYVGWNSEKQQLIRKGPYKVALKKLEKNKVTSSKWYEEVKLHLKLCNENGEFVTCYGLTKDSTDDNYMIVMRRMDADLRKYLREKERTWEEKLNIANDIIRALCIIHFKEKTIHRDLHSGNILYLKLNNHWYISDFGLCGPADESPEKIYGILPYIAPEVLRRKEHTSASDIYSFGILMWEIATRQTPFSGDKHDYLLEMEIIKGRRPETKTSIPSKYEKLMQKCWDADPHKRPKANKIFQKINKMRVDCYKNDSEFKTLEQDNSYQISTASSDSRPSTNNSNSSTSSKIIIPEVSPITEDDEFVVNHI